MNELAGQSLGGYQLEQEIGRGSMGVVYRGKQIALGRQVAVKVLAQTLARDVSYVARFIREAEIIAGLNHPNIVHIYDAGQQNKLLYFVMEYVQGPTLASLLHRDRVIAQHLAAEYAAQIADALDVAYKERHVIHRDIKPENLMLDRWGKIKVMDFGLARALGHQPITVAKTLVGSIYYASPEQVWGYVLDNRSDIYALGVVLYEMVTGYRPFSGRSMPELTQAIVGGTLQPPSTHNPELLPELERIILTALARDRDQRYEDAGTMAQLLRALMPALANATVLPLKQFTYPTRKMLQPPKRPQVQLPRYLEAQSPEEQAVDTHAALKQTGGISHMILITGATGYIGQHLVARLVSQGERPRCLVRDMKRATHVLGTNKVELVQGDTTQSATLEAAVQGVDTVVHAAFITADHKQSAGNFYAKTNVQGTSHLIKAAKTAGVKRIIEISGLGTKPDKPGTYMQGRYLAEQMLMDSGLDWTIIRPSVLFGKDAPFIKGLADLVRTAPVVPLIGGGKTMFQPIYVEDVVTVICKVLADQEHTKNKIYTIGGPAYYSFSEVFDILLQAMHISRPKVYAPTPLVSVGAAVMEAVLPRPPLTKAAMTLFSFDNVTDLDSVERHFGFVPMSFTQYMQERNI
ncbi:MAG: protein kinase [Chloroflexi bacterium]|nr:protein kinase [Ktedonobacteraceae bacterium]MBV9706076.1 protein kinase [Chloroflexota bacterium]